MRSVIRLRRALLLGSAAAALAAGSVRAQVAVPPDAVAAPAPDGPPCPAVAAPRRRVGFVLSLDNRQSFLQASAVRIIGLNAGVMLPGGRWRLGLGGYILKRDYADLYVYQYRNNRRTHKILDTLTPQLNLTYLTPNVSYAVFRRPWLEVSVPVEVGLGRSRYTETDLAGKITTDHRGLFVPVEAGLAVLVKPLRWAGASGSVGYRKSVLEIDYKEDFDGLYFSYRLNVFVGAIWRDVRHRRQERQAQRGTGATGFRP